MGKPRVVSSTNSEAASANDYLDMRPSGASGARSDGQLSSNRHQPPYAYHRVMDDKEMDRVVKELLCLPSETAKHRAAISRIAGRRRELAGRLGEVIGPTKAAQKLGVSRQTFWQILNPDQAKEIKRRSKTNTRGRTREP